jgi:hypothetical protein
VSNENGETKKAKVVGESERRDQGGQGSTDGAGSVAGARKYRWIPKDRKYGQSPRMEVQMEPEV